MNVMLTKRLNRNKLKKWLGFALLVVWMSPLVLSAKVLEDPSLPPHVFLVETTLPYAGSKKQAQAQANQQAFQESLQQIMQSFLTEAQFKKNSELINQLFYVKAERYIQTFKVISEEVKTPENMYVQKLQVSVDRKWVEEVLVKRKLIPNPNAPAAAAQPNAIAVPAATNSANPTPVVPGLELVEQQIVLNDLSSFADYFEVKKALVKIVGDKNLYEGSFAHHRISFVYQGSMTVSEIFEKLKLLLPQVVKVAVEGNTTQLVIQYRAPMAATTTLAPAP